MKTDNNDIIMTLSDMSEEDTICLWERIYFPQTFVSIMGGQIFTFYRGQESYVYTKTLASRSRSNIQPTKPKHWITGLSVLSNAK